MLCSRLSIIIGSSGRHLSNNNNATAMCMLRNFGCTRQQTAPHLIGGRCRKFNTQHSKQPPPPRSNTSLMLYSIGIGAAFGASWAGYNAWTQPRPGSTQTRAAFFIDRVPDVPIARRLQNPRDKSDLDLVLFQYQTCPFCCKVSHTNVDKKRNEMRYTYLQYALNTFLILNTRRQVRAFLDSQGLSYSVVEVDAVLRQSIKWSPYKKVPMLLAKCKDGRYIQLTESSMIISILASVLADPSKDVADLYKFYPTETFVDEAGNTRSDVLNKYFLMLPDQKTSKAELKEAM